MPLFVTCLLESAVARPQASAFGSDAYPDIVSKAAALLHSLVMNHAFLDGNKRTAVLALLVFADLNGYSVRWERQEALDLVVRLASGYVDLDEVKAFLRSRIHAKA
jgi:death on curing protein